jgi:HEAT repeat protein
MVERKPFKSITYNDRSVRLNLVAIFLLLSSVFAGPVFGQNVDQQEQSLQIHLSSRLASSDEEQRLDAVVQLGALLSLDSTTATDVTIAALANALRRDSSPVIRALSARALEFAKNPAAADPLIAALKKERQVAVSKSIIYALARYPSLQVSSELIPYLKNRNHELRAASAYALAELSDPSSTAALIELLRKREGDEDAFARAQAARGLGRFGDRQAVEPLLSALTRDKSGEVRRQAARALGNVGTRQDVKVIAALREATFSSDPYLTIAADDALELINSRPEGDP